MATIETKKLNPFSTDASDSGIKNKKIFRSKPHITEDEYFPTNTIIDRVGSNVFGLKTEIRQNRSN